MSEEDLEVLGETAKALWAAAQQAAEQFLEETEKAMQAFSEIVAETIAPAVEVLVRAISKYIEETERAESCARRQRNRPPKNLMHRWTAPARRIVPCARRGC